MRFNHTLPNRIAMRPLLIGLFAISAHAGEGEHTADYYMAMQDTFLNQPVTVYVSMVGAGGGPLYNMISGYKGFTAFTEDGESGGAIEVAVPVDAIEKFVNYFGLSSKYEGMGNFAKIITRPLTGTLLKYKSDEVYKGEALYILYDSGASTNKAMNTSASAPNGQVIKHSGDYYWAMLDTFLNQPVTVYVSMVHKLNRNGSALADDTVSGCQMLWADTYSEGQPGGGIDIAVPIQAVKGVIKKYGTEGQWNPSYDKVDGEAPYITKPLNGTLLRHKSGRPYIQYTE